MSPFGILLLGIGLATEAARFRTAPKHVASREQFREAANSLEGLMNGTLCLYAKKAKAKAGGSPSIRGVPLPEEKMNWEVEDFNPDALMRGPCGIKTEIPDRVGKGSLNTPQQQLVEALKLWVNMITEFGKVENEKACKKMDVGADSAGDGKVDQAEFTAWIDKQPFDARVKTPQGEVIDSMWQIVKKRGEDFMTIDGCKEDLKKLIKKFTSPPVM
jgi:hypothetical protein